MESRENNREPFMPGRKAKAAVVTVFLIVLAGTSLAGLFVCFTDNGFEQPSFSRYPLRGIDVSEYQASIDWGKVRRDGYAFTFIKATEGKEHVDAWFRENWRNAAKAGLARGAYHFYLFSRNGLEQAENFAATVPVDVNALPPVVDVEMGGSNGNDPDVEAVLYELGVFLGELGRHYGRPPIIYSNQVTYEKLIMGHFPDCPIWIADIDSAPGLPDGRAWAYWQYTFEGAVDGVSGLVDLNVYNSGEEGLDELILQELSAQ